MSKPKIVICMGSSCFARGNEKTVEACESFLAERGLKDEVDVDLGASLCTGNRKRVPGLLQVRPALPREGDQDRRRQGERHPGGMRRMRRMREGMPRAREEDKERPCASQRTRRLGREALRVRRAELRRILQGRHDRADRGRAQGRRLRGRPAPLRWTW